MSSAAQEHGDLTNVTSAICPSNLRKILSSTESTPNTEDKVLAGNSSPFL